MKGKTIALAVLSGAVLIGGIWFTMFRQDTSKPDNPPSSMTSEVDDNPNEKPDVPSSDKADDEPEKPKDVEIAPSDDPNRGIEIGQESDQPFIAEGELANVLTGYFNARPEYGGFAYDAELWHVTSHEDLVEKNEKFKGFYSFMSYAYFTVEKSLPSDSDPTLTIDFEPGEEITISGYATVDGNTVTIHYLNAAGEELIDDGYVDDYVYMALHGLDWSEMLEDGQ